MLKVKMYAELIGSKNYKSYRIKSLQDNKMSHGCADPKVWDSNDEWVIADYDVGLIAVQLKRK